MLQSVSIEGYTSFPGVRWRLLDPTTELVLRVEGRAESQGLERYCQWFERRFARCFRFGEERFPDGWLAKPGADALADHLAAGITALQRLACQPVRRAQVLEAEDQLIRLALPGFSGPVLQGAIQLAIQLLLELEADPAGTGERWQLLEEEIEQFVENAPAVAGSNKELMRYGLAADSLGIPVVSTATCFLEIGHGSARRFLLNSLLGTSAPAAYLASDKLASYLVLHRAGLPVPATKIVNTEADLEAAAAEIGWPLVVKPLNQSRMRGVTTDVTDLITLELAFRVARNVSQGSILLQQQIQGQEFRLTAIGESVVFAWQRTHPMVEGDGKNTVAELVQVTNQNPLRGSQLGAISACIQLGPEMISALEKQSLSMVSIPAAGQKVSLGGGGKVGRQVGGLPVNARDALHPSYFELLKRAARVLKLDVIGIDLITSDPLRPWWEVGAMVLECNSKPNFFSQDYAEPGTSAYEALLQHGLGDSVFPPIVALAGSEALDSCMVELERVLASQLSSGTQLGVLWQGMCRLGGEPLQLDTCEKGQVGQALLADPHCGGAILAWDAADLLRYGRPCERIDVGVLAEGAEPLVVQELLDADPAAVIWIGPGRQEWDGPLQAWQARDPAHRLVALEGAEGLSACLPELLGASTHQRG